MASATYSAEDVQRFYRVGALGLRAMQDRGLGPERFGAEASARYRAFRGELPEGYRLDLALRDGAASHPLAFAARSVFALDGLATDEPFGPGWQRLLPSKALPILREVELTEAATSAVPVADVLASLAQILGLSPSAPDAARVTAIQPASRVVIAGAGAIIAVAVHMAGRNDFAIADQVLLVTHSPALRQLAGIAAALTGSRRSPPSVQSAHDPRGTFNSATLLLVSDDAPPDDAEAAHALARELGAG